MNILFMGTPDFASKSLEKLIQKGHNICGVISQPDKPKGRGMKLEKTPVKKTAELKNIPVFQPESLKNEAILPLLKELNPELIVVVAYGKLLPEYVLNYPKHKCINVHGSLLPKYRGAAPIQWAIINGETQTGITIMYMKKELDAGDMLSKAEVSIEQNESFGSLYNRLADVGAELLFNTIDQIESILPEKQNDAEATFAPMITKEMCKIDFKKSATQIKNLINGLNPAPAAFAFLNGTCIKIYESFVCDEKTTQKEGKIINATKECIKVACGENSVIGITMLKEQGSRLMHVRDYLNGHSIQNEDFFE